MVLLSYNVLGASLTALRREWLMMFVFLQKCKFPLLCKVTPIPWEVVSQKVHIK